MCPFGGNFIYDGRNEFYAWSHLKIYLFRHVENVINFDKESQVAVSAAVSEVAHGSVQSLESSLPNIMKYF